MHRVRRVLAPIITFSALAGLTLPASAAHTTATPTIVTNAKHFVTSLPHTIHAGGVRFTYTNNGGTWTGFGIARLKAGVSDKAFTAGVKAGNPDKLETLATPYGGLTAEDGKVESLLTILPAARYALFDTEQGPKNTTLYKVAFFSVTGATTLPTAPKVTATITLRDMTFGAPKTLHAGTVTLKIVNKGPSDHMMNTARIAKGKTFKDVKAYIKAGPNAVGHPPVDGTSFGGVDTIAPHQTVYLTQTFTRGAYVLMCWVTDKKKNIPHVAEGMLAQIVVK